MCIFREFNKLILSGIKFSVLIRNMAPPQGEWGGGGGHLPQMPHPGSAIGMDTKKSLRIPHYCQLIMYILVARAYSIQ